MTPTNNNQISGCPSCGMAYSFYFGVQYHKGDCPEVTKVTKKETWAEYQIRRETSRYK